MAKNGAQKSALDCAVEAGHRGCARLMEEQWQGNERKDAGCYRQRSAEKDRQLCLKLYRYTP